MKKRFPLAVPIVLLCAALSVPVLPATPAAAESTAFATSRKVALHLVSDEVRVVGFHQAMASQRAARLNPVAPAVPAASVNGRAPRGTSVVMGSRNRGTHPTSAVDLAVPEDVPIASPVTGRVKRVTEYRLYGRTRDRMVVITPASNPSVEVYVMHIDATRVQKGDRVVAGETMIAKRARVLPFRSQLERYSGTMPHVHIDVRY